MLSVLFSLMHRCTPSSAWTRARRSSRGGRWAACAAMVLAGGAGLYGTGHAQSHGQLRRIPAGLGAGLPSAAISPQRPEHGAPPLGRLNLPHPGYLGIGLRDLDAAEESRLLLHGGMGAMIISVDHDAPAWTAGLRPGDIVTGFDGDPVDGVDDLRRRLRACTQGRAVTLRVLRDGTETTIPVTLGDQQAIAQRALSRHPVPGDEQAVPATTASPDTDFATPAPAPAAPAPQRSMAATLLDTLIPASSYTGLDVSPLTPQLAAFFGVPGGRGLLVNAVRPGSPAQAAGLVAGDVILRAGDRPVASHSNLAHAVRGARGAAIPLTVLRNRRQLSVTIRPGKRQNR